MPIKHPKINPKIGQRKLDALRDDLKELFDDIRHEEEFSQQVAASKLGGSDLAKKFPALGRLNA